MSEKECNAVLESGPATVKRMRETRMLKDIRKEKRKIRTQEDDISENNRKMRKRHPDKTVKQYSDNL